MTEKSDDAQSGSNKGENDGKRTKENRQKENRQKENLQKENRQKEDLQLALHEEAERSRLSSATRPHSAKFVHTQAQVDAITNIMRFNIDKVMERDKTLNELVSRADNLDEAAGAFKDTASKLKNAFWWKDFKLTIILVVVGVIIVLIVVVVLVIHFKH